ncbi:MAG: sodium ion-translocating decarboxylase subunit beta [Dechloromonas sp.]|uniref:oxaloacetate decarboxylase (Na(+) extruding) n=1 Tax=Candidatus Dechloromonas phosphorivorans TaxID=2899244 RepID=A0A9D7QHI5_9RHOO|nr:sodium ion-translocating decarboxylase subunit beta [Candidatus Dechloromonas phosphorivorans]
MRHRLFSRSSSAWPCASSLVNFSNLISETFLYGATFFLGLTWESSAKPTILNPVVLKLLLLGMLALLLSGIGGIIGGYACISVYKGKYNDHPASPGPDCVPTTAKVVQKIATQANPECNDPAACTGREHQQASSGSHPDHLHANVALNRGPIRARSPDGDAQSCRFGARPVAA